MSRVLGEERWRLCWLADSGVEIHDQDRFREWIVRRGQFEPLHYILGVREFWSLDFRVTPQVLIPRPETEVLVEESLRCARTLGPEKSLNILEIGTGSANIAVALARELPRARIVAVDCSLEALRVAAANCREHGVAGRISLLCADLASSLGGRAHFFLVVANLPYVARSELDFLPSDVRNYEPRVALDGGEGGVQAMGRLIAAAPFFLENGGFLLLEIGPEQAEWLRAKSEETGRLQTQRIVRDLAGRERVFVGRKEVEAGG